MDEIITDSLIERINALPVNGSLTLPDGRIVTCVDFYDLECDCNDCNDCIAATDELSCKPFDCTKMGRYDGNNVVYAVKGGL